MRKLIWIAFSITCFLFFQCKTQKKIVYNIPANYPEDKKKEFIALLDKGQVLFKTNCADCHGIFTRGKDNVPNFSNTQIDNYSAKFLNRDPKNHGVIRQLSPGQMNEILSFLRFKNPENGAAAATGPVKKD